MTDMVKLGDVLQPVKSARAGDREYPLLSMTMHNGLVDQFDKFNKRVASQDTSAYKVIERGQLVVGFPIDEGVLDFQTMYDEAIVSPAYGVWELSGKYEVSREYLGAYLRSDHAIAYYKAKLQGSTARRRSLPNSTFLALPIYLPSLVEQRRIVDILDRADAIRTKRRHMLADYAELRANMFYDVFGVPSRWADLWSKTTIGALTESVQYGTSAKAGADGAWPILRMGNITDDGCLDLTDLKYIDLPETDIPKYTVHAGDMLFNRTNSKEKVGKSCVVDTDWKLALAGYLVRVRFRNPLHAPFVSAFLNSTYGVKLRQRMAKAAVNQANINATEMKNINVPSPSDTALREFARRVEAITAARAKVERALALDDELFASLQSRAFRGEL